MGKELLNKIRKLNWVLQESPMGAFSFDELCEILSAMMEANVFIVNLRGKVIGSNDEAHMLDSLEEDEETGKKIFHKEYSEALLRITATQANISAEEASDILNCRDFSELRTIIPIVGGGKRWGTLVCTRKTPEFTAEDLVLGEAGATVVGLEIQRQKSLEMQEEERMRGIVQMAIGTLSYSEVEAVQRIFEELDGNEGLLIASKIADRSGITRSVIVNALRKLESAGVIESRSLGMKGTHIKVLNSKFYEELGKLSK